MRHLLPNHLLRFVAPFVAALVSMAGAASAQEEWTGLRSMGMGGAHRAIVTGNDAVYLNPAGMSVTKKYAVEGGYLHNFGGEAHAPAVSIVDSATRPEIGAGVAYGYITGKKVLRSNNLTGPPTETKVDRTGHVAHIALSMPFGKNASFGLGGKYMDVSYGGRNAVNAVSLDAGVLFRATPMVSLAVTGYGLTNSGSAEAPMAMGIAVGLGPPDTFQLGFDWVIDFTTGKYNESFAQRESGARHHFAVGIEWLIARVFALRAGYFHDRVTQLKPDNAATFGLGYFNPKSRFGFQVAFQQRFANTDDRVLLAGLQLFL
jgi:hypothetical protein